MIDVSNLTPEERAQLEAQLRALDAAGAQQRQLAPTATPTDPSVAPGPLSTPSDPPPPTDTATAPPAQPGDATAAQQPASGHSGPKVGETVAHTFTDPYADDTEVTRYGVVVGTHPADPDVAGSVDRAEIAWLPDGTAVLDVDDLDQL